MKISKKIIGSIMSILIFTTAFMFSGTFSTIVKADEIPVQLYYADLINEYAGAAGHTQGYIAIKNLSYTKNVTVHYSFDNGSTWNDVSATYYKTNTDGYEVWHFTTPSQYCANCIFSIKYEVNGQTYWDNNNGNNYSMKVGRTAFGKNLVTTFGCTNSVNSGVENLQGQICLKNISSQKVVTVRVTEDNWATYKDINAQYAYSDNFSDNEFWNFTYSTMSSTKQIQYAVCYEVNGVQYWDNNFGSNYTANY